MWWLIWGVLAVGAIVVLALLTRRLWHQGRDLVRELHRAEAVLSRLEEVSDDLAELRLEAELDLTPERRAELRAARAQVRRARRERREARFEARTAAWDDIVGERLT